MKRRLAATLLRKRFTRSPKIYLRDTGLPHALLRAADLVSAQPR